MLVRRKIAETLRLAGATQPFVVMFVGSSTTQGRIGTTAISPETDPNTGSNRKRENYVNQFAAKLVSYAGNALSTANVTEATVVGSLTRPTTNGLWFYNCSLGGTTSANYIGADRQGLMNTLQPNLMIHMVGANDYRGQSISPATFRSNLQSVVNDARTRVPGVKHLFIHSYPALDVTGNPTYKWEQYGSQAKALADSNGDCMFVDVSPLWAARGVLLNGSDPDNLVGGDNIHCTIGGYKFLAESIVTAMNMDVKYGKAIWTLDPNTYTLSNGAEITSASPQATDLEQALGGIGQTAGQRPTLVHNVLNGNKVARFDGSDDTLDINFNESYGGPFTVFTVVKLSPVGTSTLYSRTQLAHAGYLFGTVNASGQATFISHTPSGNCVANIGSSWRIIAAVYQSNDYQRVYNHRTWAVETGNSTAANATEWNLNGPFITSFRFGATTGRGNFAAMDVAYNQIVAGELSESEIINRMESLATRFALTLDPVPPPRTYLRDIGTQSYANTFQGNGTADYDPVGSDSWVDHVTSTAKYVISSYASSSRRLIPSGAGTYRPFNNYYRNVSLGSSAHWARVKFFKSPNEGTAPTEATAGGGVVLRHTGSNGIYCKFTYGDGWRIYQGASATGNTSTADPALIASGTLPSTLVAGDEMTALFTSGNRVYLYYNNQLLNPGGTAAAVNTSAVRVGVLISQNNAAELYDFKCGVMGSDTPPT